MLNFFKLLIKIKDEIEVLKNELEMKDISKMNSENAYQDLLRDYKQI